MKVLVTGASGILGQQIVHLLKQREHTVYPVYHTNKPSFGGLKVDLTDISQCQETFSDLEVDAIIHLAHPMAPSKTWMGVKTDKDTQMQAVTMLENLCKTFPRDIRFIYASSVSVYGQPSLENVPILENFPLNGSTAYAQVKIGCEQIVQENFHSSCSLRLARIISENGKNIANIYAQKARAGEPPQVNVNQDGKSPIMSMVSITDAARACIYTSINKDLTGPVNVAQPGFDMTLDALADFFKTFSNTPPKIVKGKLPEHDPTYAVMNTDKLVNTGFMFESPVMTELSRIANF